MCKLSVCMHYTIFIVDCSLRVGVRSQLFFRMQIFPEKENIKLWQRRGGIHSVAASTTKLPVEHQACVVWIRCWSDIARIGDQWDKFHSYARTRSAIRVCPLDGAPRMPENWANNAKSRNSVRFGTGNRWLDFSVLSDWERLHSRSSVSEKR